MQTWGRADTKDRVARGQNPSNVNGVREPHDLGLPRGLRRIPRLADGHQLTYRAVLMAPA